MSLTKIGNARSTKSQFEQGHSAIFFVLNYKVAVSVNPAFLGLDAIGEVRFVDALANELDIVVMRGLDICNRADLIHPQFSLRRVHYVPESERGEDAHEPDEFRKGMPPSVKLLFAVVSRLVDLDPAAAISRVIRWKHADSPVYTRLWAAISRDSRVTATSEVADFLEKLDVTSFWKASNFPEIAELRGQRFSGMDKNQQRAILERIRRKPPRSFWPRDAEAYRIERARNLLDRPGNETH